MKPYENNLTWIRNKLIATLGVGCLLLSPVSVGDEMVTSNVYQRTFMIRYGGEGATAFVVDWESRQYLVTARHVTKGISGTDQIDVFHDGKWKKLDVTVVGVGSDNVDITVLACDLLLASPSLALEPTMGNLAYSQQVYFVGFPFLWTAGGENINRDFPLPFAKTGIVSAIEIGGSALYIDAHGNKGFSGGPVVFVPSGQVRDFRVAGIVSGYPTPVLMPIVDKHGDPILDGSGQPVAYFNENPGIVIATNIKYATDLMDANPIGFPLPKTQ